MSEPIYGIPPDVIHGSAFHLLSAAPLNWGMDACFVDRLRTAGGDGEGEVIAVLDTGADPSHPEFPPERWHAPPWSDVPGEGPQDGNFHGPHCMGTAAGRTPTIGVGFRAKVMSGKCLSNSGQGQQSWIMASARKAIDRGATVVSISIGGRGFLASMEPIFQQMNARGIIPVVAAGNERQQGGIVADQSSALVVAAVNRAGQFAPFSNPAANGDILSVAAPGVDIVSARTGGGYMSMSGTSMATPFVAGIVACVQSARVKAGLPRLTTAEFKKLFAVRSVDAGTPGPDRDYGPGLIDGGLLANSLVRNPTVQ